MYVEQMTVLFGILCMGRFEMYLPYLVLLRVASQEGRKCVDGALTGPLAQPRGFPGCAPPPPSEIKKNCRHDGFKRFSDLRLSLNRPLKAADW